MTEELGLHDKITELINQLQGQRVVLGDTAIRMTVKFAIKTARIQAKDKVEFDGIINGHEAFQEFCQSLGIKSKGRSNG